MSDIATIESVNLPLADLEEGARRYAARAMGAGTKRAYRSALIRFESWCESRGLDPLAEADNVLALYLAGLADCGLAVNTLKVHAAAVRAAWQARKAPSFGVAEVMEGVVRTYGSRPLRKAAPLGPDLLRRLVALCDPATPMGCRDRAMLLLGFGGALRRSEIVSLDIGDVAIEARGVLLLVRRSKTDQEGRGQEIALHAADEEPSFCPKRALEAWLAVHPLEGAPSAPLFCSLWISVGERLNDKAVVRCIKKLTEEAGLDSRIFSGHSLRRGLATTAAENGEALADLMRQTRHRSVTSALGYIDHADLWRGNVTRRVFR